ncbi:MAG TPA: peptidyl-alpha-hydroxyglycine alpha-amidating lyase family protein [Candidatus Dormibacteraeota bacterium]|nr:peptidyl-alpha-hydroxyglycine alpha-amidating lyase family protein [Candidatus Dormibacteraeota bacterium]
MKGTATFLLLLLPGLSMAQNPPASEMFYQSVPDLLKLPAHQYLGEVPGVALNSKGHIFVYTRSGHTQLLEFDPNGAFLRIIGDDLYGFTFAHTVRIDREDNIWCVDEGANMVIKFNPEGRVVMLLGRKREAVEAPASGEKRTPLPEWQFDRPTDIAFGPHGDLYVSDGYGNSRVVKYDKDGNWLKAWGKRGTAPGEFHTPHTIVSDAKGLVYVGDRENKRIQIFDAEGNFLKQWTTVGAPWALCATPGPHQVIYSSDSASGRIYKLDLDGKILGVFGKAGKQTGQFGWVHEMACPSENTLYVAELLNWRVQKLILTPPQ